MLTGFLCLLYCWQTTIFSLTYFHVLIFYYWQYRSCNKGIEMFSWSNISFSTLGHFMILNCATSNHFHFNHTVYTHTQLFTCSLKNLVARPEVLNLFCKTKFFFYDVCPLVLRLENSLFWQNLSQLSKRLSCAKVHTLHSVTWPGP